MSKTFPWEYIEQCSDISLQNFAIAQRALAATLRKYISAETDRLIDAMVNAEVAGLLISNSERVSHIIELRQQILKFEAASRSSTVLPTQEEIELINQGKMLRHPERMDGIGKTMKRSA